MAFLKRLKRYTGIVMIYIALSALLMLLQGCMNIAAEDLYALPQLSDNGSAIVPGRNPEIIFPSNGNNRQTVYLEGIYGNGIDESVALFNHRDEWLLILPADWHGKVSALSINDVPGESIVVFSIIIEDDKILDFLKIYKITGVNREERAGLPNRNILMTENSAIYAFELLTTPNSYGITFNEELIYKNFKLIDSVLN